MRQTVNNSSFLWMICVGLVTAFLGYVLWVNPNYDASQFPASAVALLGTVAVGAFTFGLMCLTWFISLFRNHDTYKPFLGLKTSHNVLMAIVMMIFMGVEMFGLSYKGNLAMAQKQAEAAYQASLVTPDLHHLPQNLWHRRPHRLRIMVSLGA